MKMTVMKMTSRYLWSAQSLYQGHQVQGRVFGLQALHLGVQSFPLCTEETRGVVVVVVNTV